MVVLDGAIAVAAPPLRLAERIQQLGLRIDRQPGAQLGDGVVVLVALVELEAALVVLARLGAHAARVGARARAAP